MSVPIADQMQGVVNVQSPSISVMPASPNRKPITVRCDPEQHDAWVKAATLDGRPLSQWLARLADVAAGYTPKLKPPRKKRAKKPTTKRRAKGATS